MEKKINYTLLLIFTLFITTTTQAQRRFVPTNSAFTKAYTDSLAIYKAKLDSIKQVNDSIQATLSYPTNISDYSHLLCITLTSHNAILTMAQAILTVSTEN